jgi:hypothetical protein
MTLRKLIFAAFLCLLSLQVAAITLDELKDYYYTINDSLAMGDSDTAYQYITTTDFNYYAAEFFAEDQELSELDEAMQIWISVDKDYCAEYIDANLDDAWDGDRYRYLGIYLQDDPQIKLDMSHALIDDYPEYEGGYRALLLAYMNGFEGSELFRNGSEDNATFMEDIPDLLYFGRTFPDAQYARMALIIAYIAMGNISTAIPIMREALDNEDLWLEEFDLSYFIPLERYHDLLRFQIETMKETADDEYTLYRISEYAGNLLGYYLDQAKDYDTIIDVFGAEPFYWQNQYIVYGLVQSYYNTDAMDKATGLLTYGDDPAQAKNFQDAWLNFNANEAQDMYSTLLSEDSSNPLESYLYARAQQDVTVKLGLCRKLIRKYPRLEYGFDLMTEGYLGFFGAISSGDPLYQTILKQLDTDAQNLFNYYFRFPTAQQAKIAYLLGNIRRGNDSRTLKLYKQIYTPSLSYDIPGTLDKLIVGCERYDLLRQVKETVAQLRADNEEIKQDEVAKLAIVGYCETLYNGAAYARLEQEITQNQLWLDITDIQFLLVNTYYNSQDYTKTIATLRLMVEKGTIGMSLLSPVDDPNLTNHPDWQPLLDFASTKPEPVQQMNSDETEIQPER